jgi:hypothetical protein
LGVIVDILYDDAPFTFNVHCPDRSSVQDITGANVSFAANPVALIERETIVVGIIEFVLF